MYMVLLLSVSWKAPVAFMIFSCAPPVVRHVHGIVIAFYSMNPRYVKYFYEFPSGDLCFRLVLLLHVSCFGSHPP